MFDDSEQICIQYWPLRYNTVQLDSVADHHSVCPAVQVVFNSPHSSSNTWSASLWESYGICEVEADKICYTFLMCQASCSIVGIYQVGQTYFWLLNQRWLLLLIFLVLHNSGKQKSGTGNGTSVLRWVLQRFYYIC